MEWKLEEAAAYYKRQGAPGDQTALIGLLREIQSHHGGSIPGTILSPAADLLGTKESLLRAIIRQIPSLHLQDNHCLELCAGPNCSRHPRLAALAQQAAADYPRKLSVRFTPCMRMCAKGPNLKWDGTLYHQADEALLRRLLSQL